MWHAYQCSHNQLAINLTSDSYACYCSLLNVCIYAATSLDGMKDLVAETAIMKAFHHLNVLPLLGVCIDYDDDDVLKIVIPFMAHGDLRTFLKESRVSPNNTHEYPKVNAPSQQCTNICILYSVIMFR